MMILSPNGATDRWQEGAERSVEGRTECRDQRLRAAGKSRDDAANEFPRVDVSRTFAEKGQ